MTTRSPHVLRRLSLLLAVAAWALSGADTGLDKYVRTPDPAYKYELVKTLPGSGYTTYVIDLTSQQWRSASEVNRTVWKHWLTIVRPDEVKGSTGLLFISGGSVKAAAPEKPNPFYVEMATATHSVVAELSGIPNEPLEFTDEKRTRNEDQIIAYTWVKYLKTGDETWPLRMPMTKAAVRAMDTISAFSATAPGGGVNVANFFVAGASKRGWTTWTTAAVDKRVIAFSPLVIDMLNMTKSFEHHFEAYGAYSEAIQDYVDMGIMKVTNTPEYAALMRLVEPFSYRDRYTMPKLIVNAAGDQYFLPDSSQFYFDRLPGEKYLRYVPNTDHSLAGSDARESLIAFYDAVIHNTPRPRFSWSFEKNGDIKVTCADKPSEVKMWAAHNPDKRDFRLMTIGPAYKATVLASAGGGEYLAHPEKPATGWTAYFVELTFPGGTKYPLKFTTAVRVTPDTLPYPTPKPTGKIADLP
jgi:PhoPQ-activated pathogenicity-related protein